MGAVLAIVALLVGGTSLADAILPGSHPLRAGEEILVDEDPHQRISMTMPGDGWARDLDAGKGVGDTQRFARGPLEVRVMPVTLAAGATADADRLWEGMGDILRTRDTGARLAEPAPITSEQGVDGLMGPVLGLDHEAMAVLYPSPGGGSAVQMVFSAPEATALDEVVVAGSTSVVFTDNEEGA